MSSSFVLNCPIIIRAFLSLLAFLQTQLLSSPHVTQHKLSPSTLTVLKYSRIMYFDSGFITYTKAVRCDSEQHQHK